jgi:hypothetical protein
MSTVLVLLIAAAAATILTSNLALADWKTSFQQKPQIATDGLTFRILLLICVK